MNELHFAHKIRQHLNQGLQQLPSANLNRLDEARQKAVACKKQVVSRSVLAYAGHFAIHQIENLNSKQVFASFALLLCIAISTFWMADQHVSEMGAIDSALLADELPIRAFTDKGFDAWLKRSSQL